MFAIKDLESIKNLAAILVVPFFSAAILSDRKSGLWNDPVLNWFISGPDPLAVVGWGLAVLLSVLIVGLCLMAFDWALVWLHVALGESYIMVWVGFASITVGLFAFSALIAGLPKLPINTFWQLGFLCYGFSLLDRAGKQASKL